MPKNVILIRNFNTMGWEIGDFSSHERKGGEEPVMALKGPRSTTLSGQQPLRWSQHWHIGRNFYNRKFTLHAHVCMCASKVEASYLWQQTDDSAGKQHSLPQCWTDLLLKVFRCREWTCVKSFALFFLMTTCHPHPKKPNSGAAPAQRPPVFYMLAVTSCFCSTQPGAQHLPLSPQRMQNGHTTVSLTEKPTQIRFVAATWSRWHTEMGWYSTKRSVYPFWITSWPLVTWPHLKPTNRVSQFGKVQFWKIKYQADTCEVTVVFSLRKP